MNKNTNRIGWALSIVTGVGLALGLSRCGGNDAVTINYVQIERLGRPAINEGLVSANANLNAFNSIGPSLDLQTSTAAIGAVITDAAATLTAFYKTACALSLSPPNSSGVTKCSGTTATNDYINNVVVAGFLPDVMRINTSTASGYNAATCGTSPGVQLCGGRKITDAVVDITYSYLLNGDPTGASVSNGVTYAGANTKQGHKAVLSDFPYLAAPY